MSSTRKVDSQTKAEESGQQLKDASPSSGHKPTQVEIEQHAYRIHVDPGSVCG
jgi:hypothetical protein